ncbi:MAG: DNA-directed RNA polymerase subunit beta', partial [Chloroflexota bacterium]
LAAPVAHIWFAKGIPSRLGLLLDMSPRSLERVLYFAQYVVIRLDTEARGKLVDQTQQDAQKAIADKDAEVQNKHAQVEEKIAPKTEPHRKHIEAVEKAIRAETDKQRSRLEKEAAALGESLEAKVGKKVTEPVQFNSATVVKKGDTVAQRHLSSLKDLLARALKEVEAQAAERTRADTESLQAQVQEIRKAALQEVQPELTALDEEKERLQSDLQTRLDDLEEMRPLQLYTENRYRDLKQKYGDIFTCGMGAEAILEILKDVDLEKLRSELYEEIRSTSGQRRKKATKRLRVVEALRKSTNKPEWMILKVLPVLPPELRPMVQLDGGRFATSDLNDLYRRVINRNNRLRRLLELGAPEIIVRNEKRMLQESVDALIDNGRRGRAISGSHNHKLKSMSDLLRGKQGRFRQNLLGKRVDYSGRSVIVVGPELRLGQCGLPKRMALELFKPFVIHHLVARGMAHNIKSAKRMVERSKPEVWDVLEDAIKDRVVLLNRAPTLHRLGIQAFEPVLIEGSAIQLHPLVCTAFNADFDGDQMAVHVPLSYAAVMEAKKVMLSTKNMLSPASGEPLVAPTLDMVLGCYYLTMERQGGVGEGMVFGNFDEAKLANDLGVVDLHSKVRVRIGQNGTSQIVGTTVGRIIFNETLPESMRFRNQLMDKKSLKELVAECYHKMGNEVTADVLDKIKRTGFRYATQSGITIGIADLAVPGKKKQVLAKADAEILETDTQFRRGLITEDERYSAAVQIWTRCSEEMETIVKEELPKYGGIYLMATSGAKGNIAQIKQMAGMRGLMSDPRGRIIDLPIRASFREGLSVLEYFISTHGARKGLADTALRTADSGYLTRRLIDVA